MPGSFPRRHMGQIARGTCYARPLKSGKNCLGCCGLFGAHRQHRSRPRIYLIRAHFCQGWHRATFSASNSATHPLCTVACHLVKSSAQIVLFAPSRALPACGEQKPPQKKGGGSTPSPPRQLAKLVCAASMAIPGAAEAECSRRMLQLAMVQQLSMLYIS